MKRIIFLLTVVLMTTGMQAAGTVVRDTIHGTPCKVYVPNGGDKYPVLYLHHGMWGNEDDWTEKGRLVPIMDSLLQLGQMKEIVVVMPDNCPGRPTPEEERANATTGEWESQFADFMREAENRYPILADPSHRAVAGLSMGGYHTMRVASVWDGQFRYVGMFSAATFVHNYTPSAQLLWIAIGTDDFLYESLKEYRQWLDANGYAYTYYESAGGHDWPNWQDYIVRFLKICQW